MRRQRRRLLLAVLVIGSVMSGPAPGLRIRHDRRRASVPRELITGCFVLQDRVPGVGECIARITHAALNKDNGIIDPVTGASTRPETPRGLVEQNFAKAVAAAIDETRRQWRDFRSDLATRYGNDRASLMICALVRDDPADDCRRPQSRTTTVMAFAILLVAGAVLVAFVLFIRRRRSRI